jgi:hypothetical protein
MQLLPDDEVGMRELLRSFFCTALHGLLPELAELCSTFVHCTALHGSIPELTQQ